MARRQAGGNQHGATTYKTALTSFRWIIPFRVCVCVSHRLFASVCCSSQARGSTQTSKSQYYDDACSVVTLNSKRTVPRDYHRFTTHGRQKVRVATAPAFFSPWERFVVPKPFRDIARLFSPQNHVRQDGDAFHVGGERQRISDEVVGGIFDETHCVCSNSTRED